MTMHQIFNDLLLVFNDRAAIFQLYSGGEHEMDDKMNMKC